MFCKVRVADDTLVIIYKLTVTSASASPLCTLLGSDSTSPLLSLEEYIPAFASSGSVGYPMSAFPVNAIDGALCVVGVSPEPARDYGIFHTHYDSSGANCGSAVFVIFVYIVSTVVLLQAINHVLESSGDKQLSRCICVAILCSFVVLEVYDYFVLSSDFSFFGKSMRVFDFISIALLLYGIEVYGREDQPDAEVVTNYSPPTTSRA